MVDRAGASALKPGWPKLRRLRVGQACPCKDGPNLHALLLTHDCDEQPHLLLLLNEWPHHISSDPI